MLEPNKLDNFDVVSTISTEFRTQMSRETQSTFAQSFDSSNSNSSTSSSNSNAGPDALVHADNWTADPTPKAPKERIAKAAGKYGHLRRIYFHFINIVSYLSIKGGIERWRDVFTSGCLHVLPPPLFVSGSGGHGGHGGHQFAKLPGGQLHSILHIR